MVPIGVHCRMWSVNEANVTKSHSNSVTPISWLNVTFSHWFESVTIGHILSLAIPFRSSHTNTFVQKCANCTNRSQRWCWYHSQTANEWASQPTDHLTNHRNIHSFIHSFIQLVRQIQVGTNTQHSQQDKHGVITIAIDRQTGITRLAMWPSPIPLSSGLSELAPKHSYQMNYLIFYIMIIFN